MRIGESSARRLRIGIDAHAIGQRKTGNERFISHVVRELLAISDHDFVLYFTDARAADDWRGHRTEVRLLWPRHPMLRIPFVLPIAALRDRLDVLLVQYASPPLLPCPFVTVVHDISFARHPEYFRWTQAAWMRVAIPWSMGRAARVVTVSEFSRAEIEDRYGLSEDHIVVAPNGVDPIFSSRPKVPPSIPAPFFLAVGNLQPRKNLATLIRAFELLKGRNAAIREKLVIVGQDFYRANRIRNLAPELQRSGALQFIGYVGDADLVALVQEATALAYPSVYEGFALPVAEAMAAGTPAVVSDIPVIREVAGDAALRVNARDVAGWAAALERIALDTDLQRALAAAGKVRAERFSWRTTAFTILKTLEAATG